TCRYRQACGPWWTCGRSCGRPCASPWSVEGERDALLPLLAVTGTGFDAAGAAHLELAADGGTVLVDRATQVQRIDGRAPAVLVLGHDFHAVAVDVDVPGRHPVAWLQQDRQSAAHRIAARAIHAGIPRAQDRVPCMRAGVRDCAGSTPGDRRAGRNGTRMSLPWSRLR